MLQEGANTPFDIWYLYDKDIYKDSEEFKPILDSMVEWGNAYKKM